MKVIKIITSFLSFFLELKTIVWIMILLIAIIASNSETIFLGSFGPYFYISYITSSSKDIWIKVFFFYFSFI